MSSYIINFITYTMAMIGFIVLALYVYKKTMYSPTNTIAKNFLKIESILRLSATKTVYVIKAGTERFLVAGDSANTTMLAKLDENNIVIEEEMPEVQKVDFSSIKDVINKIKNRG